MSTETTLRIPKGTLEKVGALGNVGTLCTLLVIGWQAKDAFDAQFAQVNDLADQVEALSVELREATDSSKNARSELREDLAEAQHRLDELTREIARIYEKIARIEECLTNRRRCKL